MNYPTFRLVNTLTEIVQFGEVGWFAAPVLLHLQVDSRELIRAHPCASRYPEVHPSLPLSLPPPLLSFYIPHSYTSPLLPHFLNNMLVSSLTMDNNHSKVMLPNIKIFVSEATERRTESVSSFEDDCSCTSVTGIEASASPLERGSPNSEDDIGQISLAMDSPMPLFLKTSQLESNTKLPNFEKFSLLLKDSSLYPRSFVPKAFFSDENSPKAQSGKEHTSLIDHFLGKRKADELWGEIIQKKFKGDNNDFLDDKSLFDEALSHMEDSLVSAKRDVGSWKPDTCSGVALLAQIAAAQEYQMAANCNAYRSARDALLAGNMDTAQNRSNLQEEDKSKCDGSARVSKKSKKGRRHHSRDSVTILQKWLFANFRNPFPNLLEKQQLANATGLTVEQIVHWFNNARKRICSRVKVK
eukprot:760124-Hanusia_phi.AAC.3